MTQEVVFTDIDTITGIGSIIIKTSDNGEDTYNTKDVVVSQSDIDSIRTILNNYI